MATQISHHPEHHRFVAAAEGSRGHLDYRQSGGVITLLHTEVDPALEGRGVAGALVRAVVDHAAALGLKVDAKCDYARSWMQRHPETLAFQV